MEKRTFKGCIRWTYDVSEVTRFHYFSTTMIFDMSCECSVMFVLHLFLIKMSFFFIYLNKTKHQSEISSNF